MMARRAAFPWKDGRPPHLPCGPGDVAANALLPGDPERVGIAATLLEDVRDFGRRREFHLATGRFGTTEITLCSTGIGGPSTEIAVVELANLGVRRAVRIGGMGALTEDLPLGGFLIVGAASGGTGTARVYGADGALAASPAIVAALAEAARALGVPYKIGKVFTTDSYYHAQGRPLHAEGDADDALIGRLLAAGVDGIDMEAEALFAVGRAMEIEVGAILAVHGHRGRDTWLEDYEPVQRRVVEIAARALTALDGQ